MIKPEELRIGNLVAVHGIVYTVVELKLNEIGLLKDTGTPQEIDYHSYEDVNSISLTEEWLLKLGFEKEDEGSVSFQFHYGENPVTKDYLISLIWIKDYKNNNNALEGFPFYKNGHFAINTIHQLQNLFHAPTGEELQLKN